MSIIPEIIIQRALVDGIRKVRNIPWKSEQLFRSVPRSFSEQFSTLIENTPIDITINYPREDSQFPCIAILLRAEEETDVFVGDLLSSGYDDSGSLFGSEGMFYTEGESSSATSYGLGGVTAQAQEIADIPKIFDKSKLVYKERRGSGFSCSYLLQVMTDNQDFTVFLYHLVRYIILSNITMFTVNGIHQLRLSGTDFLPQAAQQPNFVFMRGINMSFLYFADHYVVDGIEGDDIEAAAKAFVINIADARSDSPDMLAQTQVPNVQSMSVATGATGTSIVKVSAGDLLTVTSGTSETIIAPVVEVLLNQLIFAAGTFATVPESDVSYSLKGGITSTGNITLLVDGREALTDTNMVFGGGIILTGINFQYGISIDFVLPAPDVASGGPFDKLGSKNGVTVSNLVFGDSEEVVAATFSSMGAGASTTTKFVTSETVSGILPGMFVEVLGPSTHAAYLEKRRVVSSASNSITVSTDFSGSLSGAIIQVIKLTTVSTVSSVDGDAVTKKLTFDVTIAADTPTGVWDLKVTNPDLISSTLTNSFTIT